MENKVLAELADVTVATIINWKKDKPELIKLMTIGLNTEKHFEATKEYLLKQKKDLEASEINLEYKEVKTKKTELADRINVNQNTIKNWESTKPELIRIIDIALASEKHLSDVEGYLEVVGNKI